MDKAQTLQNLQSISKIKRYMKIMTNCLEKGKSKKNNFTKELQSKLTGKLNYKIKIVKEHRSKKSKL